MKKKKKGGGRMPFQVAQGSATCLVLYRGKVKGEKMMENEKDRRTYGEREKRGKQREWGEEKG